MVGGVVAVRCRRLLGVGVLAALVWCSIGVERARASTQTYDTAGSYSFTVPAGVTSIAVAAIGGAGGDCIGTPSGGEGGSVTATVPVAPGEQLLVWVAGAGAACDNGGGGGFGGGAAGGTARSVQAVVVAARRWSHQALPRRTSAERSWSLAAAGPPTA
jgi:hypothetical protein